MLNFKIKDFKSIVKEIEFKIYPKKISFIIGKNGLGKSNVLDAIDWFANGSNSSNINNNITSESTSSDYNSKAVVVLTHKLNEEKIKEINTILSKHYTNLSKPKVINTYIEKSSDSPSYNYLYEENGDLTELAQIINDLISLYVNNWLDKRFFKISSKGTYSINTDLTKEKIEKLNNLSKELKSKHVKLFEDIKKIESLYKDKPIVIYIKNADLENQTKYSYFFDEFNQKEKNKNFMDLLRFLGDDVLAEMTKLTEINSINENGDKQASRIINKINKVANLKLKELFDRFDIYGYPEIKSHETKINIEVISKEEYEYDDVDTEFNSSGYKAFYQLMLNLENAKYYVKKNNQKVIILADEPDKNLHPLLQQQLADYLTEFAKNNPNIYFVITTHSPFLLKDLKNDFYIAQRTETLTENGKKEGSTFFNHFQTKMPNKPNNIKNLYTLLVAAQLYPDENSFFSSLSEKYVIYTNGNLEIDLKLKDSLFKLGFKDIKIRPISNILDKNKIFNEASIYDYVSETSTVENIMEIREKLEKGEIILFQPANKKVICTEINQNELKEKENKKI